MGDIYCNLELIERDVLVIFFKNKGYFRVDLLSSYYDYFLANIGRLDRYFISTNMVIHKYLLKNIRPFYFENIEEFKNIGINDLILLNKTYKHKKSGF